ncbi:LIN1-like protein [Podospora fimiseda]|uniref:LIN1-like protein n=1 Tax=Podospora fimiseda TaxID=252190 RepID=A0AAN7BS15_9PEZI|nr:LIN1-like protein [Podospora fimiseda]
MASRFSAARPKRAAEAFARAHHGEQGGSNNKKVKFDVRNPSALAPTAATADSDEEDEEDEVLAADVVGTSGRATKRGAVNIDGYDSDSENENFEDRAEARRGKKGKSAEDVDLNDVLDNYNSKNNRADKEDDDDDEEVDMFGGGDSDEDREQKEKKSGRSKKDRKTVQFLDDDQIEGQEGASKSGGTVRIDTTVNNSDDEDDSEDEAAVAAAIAEEDIDEEVGAGGRKKHAPKIDAFNMRAEQEEGAFDEAGNFIRKAADADAVHDRWLEGVSRKQMKKAAAAHEKREAEQRRLQRENDSILTGDLLRALIVKLERGETALDALARLRKSQGKPAKKVPKWKLKKKAGKDAMDVDGGAEEKEDPKQVKIKEAIIAIADAADKLIGREYPEIYDTERERLVRLYRSETGDEWVEPPPEPEEEENGAEVGAVKMWEFRWIDGRDDGNKQGPFDGPTMEAWKAAGYFGEGVEFRLAGDEGEWTRVATFV